MKPCRGEKPPFMSSSRSQTWRAVRSQDGHSREWAFNSAALSGAANRSMRSPPCGAIKWLIEADKCVNLPGSSVIEIRTRKATVFAEGINADFRTCDWGECKPDPQTRC